jgi:hypothetical protein
MHPKVHPLNTDDYWTSSKQRSELALMLSGIALALVTIGDVASFQFQRISDLIRTGNDCHSATAESRASLVVSRSPVLSVETTGRDG